MTNDVHNVINFRNIDVNISNEINEKINDAFFDDFENVTNLNVENFVVVLNEMIDKIVDKIVDKILFYFFIAISFRNDFIHFFRCMMLTNVFVKFIFQIKNFFAMFANDFFAN